MVPRLFFVRHGEAAHNPLLGTAAWIEREKPAKHLRSAHRLFFANFSFGTQTLFCRQSRAITSPKIHRR